MGTSKGKSLSNSIKISFGKKKKERLKNHITNMTVKKKTIEVKEKVVKRTFQSS
jgi:hypothetical protein